jgi:hypothetical protein
MAMSRALSSKNSWDPASIPCLPAKVPHPHSVPRIRAGSSRSRIPRGRVDAGGLQIAGLYEVDPEGGNCLEVFHGPGGGICFYLRNVVFPAFGADFAYNVSCCSPVLSASLGLSMPLPPSAGPSPKEVYPCDALVEIDLAEDIVLVGAPSSWSRYRDSRST